MCAAPDVSYKDYVKDDLFYTLLMCDPDVPSYNISTTATATANISTVKSITKEYVHWVVVNIPGTARTQVTAHGTTVLSYQGAMPSYNSGTHRYIFLLYEQSNYLLEKDVASSRGYFMGRNGVSTHNWVKSTICKTKTLGSLMSSSSSSTTKENETSTEAELEAEKEYRVIGYPLGVNGFSSEWTPDVDTYHHNIGYKPPNPYQSPSQVQGVLPKQVHSSSQDSTGQTKSSGVGGGMISAELRSFMTAYPTVFSGGKYVM